MLPTLLITFREGIESFLIISVITAYLRRIDRAGLIPGVRVGVALSVVTSLAGAWLWLRVPNQPVYEGVAALVAALFVGTMLWQAVRAGRRLKGSIEARVAGAASSPRALAGIALLTAFLITREGLEAVFYVGIQVMAARAGQDPRGLTLVAGGAAGVALAGLVAWIWTRYARRLNLGVVLKVTSVFLCLFLAQLVIYGVHELAESGVIEGSQHFHDLTEAFGPDGRFGHLLSYSLVAAPALYLAWVRRSARLGQRAA
ncbi:MAG TPA: FTR1 family protein [Polyangia bacterium]|nr:FTR1 family protein [Polyangia bacterium]